MGYDYERKKDGFYMSKTAAFSWVAFFVVAILSTAAITYCLSSDTVYLALFGKKVDGGNNPDVPDPGPSHPRFLPWTGDHEVST